MHSIRSRYSLSTAVFLLFLLALFYAGGRVVLVHLVRDAENQVKEIGSDLSRLVYKDAELARRRMEASLSEMTSLAISRLTLFVAIAGILVVLPIFWIQGRILLNPLTRMTKAVRELGERHRFDAHLGGIDTVRLLRAFRVGAPHVPVVVSSGSSEEEIREMFSAHPYDVFLAKPYTLEELKRAVSASRS